MSGYIITAPRLELAIRDALGKPTGELTIKDLHRLTGWLFATRLDISDLGGIEHCINLISLDLWGNKISDLKPLSGLRKLKKLQLDRNRISDISPLTNLTNLEILNLDHNAISSLNGLESLINLSYLSLGWNRASDLTPVINLKKLQNLFLNNNNIIDVRALVLNTGLSKGTYIDLSRNPFDLGAESKVLENIQVLQDRGVSIKIN